MLPVPVLTKFATRICRVVLEPLGSLLAVPGRLWEAFGRLVAAFWTRPEASGRALECSVWEIWPFGLGLVLDPLRSLRARL